MSVERRCGARPAADWHYVMLHEANPMAQAWLDAGRDLRIRVVHPFSFTSRSGKTAVTQGVFLPDFGSTAGMLLLCRFDSDAVHDIAEDTEFYSSGLNPIHYEPYDRLHFIEALNDWGWFGDPSVAPDWFSGRMPHHGGAA